MSYVFDPVALACLPGTLGLNLCSTSYDFDQVELGLANLDTQLANDIVRIREFPMQFASLHIFRYL